MKTFSYVTIWLIAVLCCAQCTTKKVVPINAETALQRYIDNGDKFYDWQIKSSYQVSNVDVTAYDLLLTSQKWRDYVWKHQLTILVPDQIQHDGALLFITGGSNKNSEPNWKDQNDDLTKNMGVIAQKNNAVICIVRQTPNQPLYGDLVEDQLISYTLHNYKSDGDFSWPLLFPMVKTAIKAMDAIQEFSEQEKAVEIRRFVVSGGSKRGWTTWLTGATDPRVTAIAPMVIDVLNMPVSLDYQIEAWNEYSIQIEDYTKLEIPQSVHSEKGDQITQMVDPYSYRQNLTMPKMIFIGTNDEYWPVDAIKNYFDSIPGDNYIQYVPNAGHDLGDGVQAFQALSSFLSFTLQNQSYPICKWSLEENGSTISLTAQASSDILQDAIVWTAESTDRDFRDETWTSSNLDVSNVSQVHADITPPETGFKAFYMDLKYTDLNGDSFVESTRMFVADSTQVL